MVYHGIVPYCNNSSSIHAFIFHASHIHSSHLILSPSAFLAKISIALIAKIHVLLSQLGKV